MNARTLARKLVWIRPVAIVMLFAGLLIFLATDKHSRPFPGDRTDYYPFAPVPGVVKFAGEDAQLVRIHASGVNRAGKIDFTSTEDAYVEYRFARELPDDQPIPVMIGSGHEMDLSRFYRYEVITITVTQPLKAFNTPRGRVIMPGMRRTRRLSTFDFADEIVGYPRKSLAEYLEGADGSSAVLSGDLCSIVYDFRGMAVHEKKSGGPYPTVRKGPGDRP